MRRRAVEIPAGDIPIKLRRFVPDEWHAVAPRCAADAWDQHFQQWLVARRQWEDTRGDWRALESVSAEVPDGPMCLDRGCCL